MCGLDTGVGAQQKQQQKSRSVCLESEKSLVSTKEDATALEEKENQSRR